MTLEKLARQDVSAAVKTGLVFFSSVHLGTTEFIRNSLPSPHILVLPAKALIMSVVLIQIVPFLLIVAADWLIRRKFSAKASSRFRVAVMAGAVLLLVRQAQLYFGPAKEFSDKLEPTPVLFVVAMLALSSFAVWLTVRLQSGLRTFFYYFSPVAIFLTVLIPFTLRSENARYSNYSAAEVAPATSSLGPVFIVVFDEFSYSVLLDESGQIDEQRYPNFARLGAESLHLKNATSNYFHTWVVVPELIDAASALASEYEVRLYEQTHRIAAIYADGCGRTYTCRDVNYLRQRRTGGLSLTVASRTLYAALPDLAEKAAKPLLHPMLRAFGGLPPTSDTAGIHAISTDFLAQYLGDIKAEKAAGRIFFLHTLLPHFPYVFNDEGNFVTDENINFDFTTAVTPSQEAFDEIWPHYRQQVEYADRFIGDLIATLEREGLYEKSTLIVTGDHGLRLSYPKENRPIELKQVTASVPMFIRSPGVQARISDIDYQHTDFASTLFDIVDFEPAGLLAPLDRLAGMPVPVSALDEVRPERDKIFFADWENNQYWRYVFDEATGEWEQVEFVDAPVGDRTELGKD